MSAANRLRILTIVNREEAHQKTPQFSAVFQNRLQMPLKAVFDWMVKNCDYDQIIWETRKNGSKWIHVSYNPSQHNRKQAWTCADGKIYNVYKK